jgi:hypothetical protein
LSDRERRASFHDISGGGAVHLVDVYAHNAVREIIQNARITILNERGQFNLPSEFMDRLIVDCGGWAIDRGAQEAELRARKCINDYLDSRDHRKNEDNERKAKQSLKGTGYRAQGTGCRVATDDDRR